MLPLGLTILTPLAAALLGWILRRGEMPLALLGAVGSCAGASWLCGALAAGESKSFSLGNFAGFQTGLSTTSITCLLTLIVAWIALGIFVFAIQYMRGKGHATWFWAAMSLFLAGMQLLVLAGDWFVFIVGWEWMGLASFLLIATEHEEAAARRGAVKAFLLTRTTDLGLYLGIFAVVTMSSSLGLPNGAGPTLGWLGAGGFMVAAAGKSAQVPFQSWLRGAMAGPTPVSALLHSATMVGAGAILLLRVTPLFDGASLQVVAYIGIATALGAGLTAIAARDLKHLLAASTSSHLGLMFFAIGLGSPGAALAHWIAHAFMKASLFLGAGLFQERFGGTAMERLAGAGRRDRFTFSAFLLAGLALAGLPPLIGYTSKDAILGVGLEGSDPWVHFTLAALAALATAVYIGRACALLWGTEPGKRHEVYATSMIAGLVMLLVAVLTGGFWLDSVVKLAGYQLPKHTTAKVTGGVVLLVGVVLGVWWRQGAGQSATLGWSRNNYPVLGGYRTLIAIPTMRVAQSANRLEDLIRRLVEAVGAGGLRLAATNCAGVEGLLDAIIRTFGRGGLGFARISHERPESWIARLISRLASSSRGLGQLGRQWQSGLVHRELLITVGTTAALLIVLILTIGLT